MAYTTIELIRAKTEYTTSDIADADITNAISEATTVINKEINTGVIREKVEYIDNTRQNKFDDSNTTFYVNNSIINNFGDSDDSGDITVGDIKIEVENTDDEIIESTVSSIDVEGSYVLSSAPVSATTIAMYATYKYTHYDITTPDKLIQLLTTYLASSYAILIVESGLPSTTKLGNISVTVPVANTKHVMFMNKYLELLKKVKIPSNKPRVRNYNYSI